MKGEVPLRFNLEKEQFFVSTSPTENSIPLNLLQQKIEPAKAGAGVDAAAPKTLAMLLEEFLRLHAAEKLASKTIERYRQLAAYLDPNLLAMPFAEVSRRCI